MKDIETCRVYNPYVELSTLKEGKTIVHHMCQGRHDWDEQPELGLQCPYSERKIYLSVVQSKGVLLLPDRRVEGPHFAPRDPERRVKTIIFPD